MVASFKLGRTPRLLSLISSAVRIFNFTEDVLPGDYMQVQGAFPVDAKIFVIPAGQLNPLLLLPLQNSDGSVKVQAKNHTTVRMHPALALNEYEVFVEYGGVRYASVYVNRTHVQYAVANKCTPGGQFELHGHNLLFPGFTPRVFFTPVGGGPALEATLDLAKSDFSVLRFTTPTSLTPGVQYLPSATNGLTTQLQACVSGPVLCMAASEDPLSLAADVPFYPYYRYAATKLQVANGNDTDMSDAIQAKLNQARDTTTSGVFGAAVVLHGGNKLTKKLDLHSNVALEYAPGAYTFMEGEALNGFSAFECQNTENAALINPNHYNRSTDGTLVPWNTMYVTKATRFLVKGGNIELRESTWMQAFECDEQVWLDGRVQQGRARRASPRRGPLRLDGSKRIIIKRMRFDTTIDAFATAFCTGVITDCKHYWNGLEGNYERVVNHLHAMGGCKDLFIRGGHYEDETSFGVTNKNLTAPKEGQPKFPGNDGEPLIAEEVGSDGNRAGRVTAAGPLFLKAGSTLGQSAPINFSGLNYPCGLIIIAGTGVGQVRDAISGSGSQVNISKAWDVELDTTSRFALSGWSADYVSMSHCTFKNLKRGPLFYHVMSRSVRFRHLNMINTPEIDVAPKYYIQDNIRHEVTVAVNTYMDYITNDGHTDPGGGAFLASHVTSKPERTFGVGIINDHKRHCKLRSATGKRVIIDHDGGFASSFWTGLQRDSDFENYIEQENYPAVLGGLIENCEAEDLMHYAKTGSGSTNIAVVNMKHKNCGPLLNEVLPGSAIGARNLVELNTTTF